MNFDIQASLSAMRSLLIFNYSFQVSGCFEEIPDQVQLLLTEIIQKAGNQSTLNIERAEKNLILAEQYFDTANQHELSIRAEKEDLRRMFEAQLLDYGRFEVRANDTCKPLTCDISKYICRAYLLCHYRFKWIIQISNKSTYF